VTPPRDDGFHEIQLNGKQVVFLFMAATVVSVVIFLWGVLVGRGVRAERGTVADAAPVSAAAETTPPPQPQAAPPATPAGSDPRAAAPPPAVDDLSYFNRLETKTPPKEQLKAASEKVKPEAEKAAAPAAPPAVERPTAPAPKEPPRAITTMPAAPPVSGEPAGPGYVVQIAALNSRSEAEAIAKRLSAKGYAAYVLPPTDGTPAIFRVRIGKFPTRREAEPIVAKLKKEEQLNPWVTR
jgi:septal ring-binding cell division protein DamX